MKAPRSRASTTPTLGSVAREVGVDLSLVSRVLRGDEAARVSSHMRSSIVAAAQRQGYRPNRIARSLRTGRTSILGMLTPDITNPFHSMLFRGVEATARAAGYDTLLGDTGDSPARLRAVVNALAEGHVDGLLVATAMAQDDTVDWLRTIGLPFHLINRRRDTDGDPWVGPDDFQTGYLGGEHLLKLGHRRIALLAGDTAVWNHRQRLAGFRAALQDENPYNVYDGPATRQAGRDHVARLLQQRRAADRAVCASQTLLCEGALDGDPPGRAAYPARYLHRRLCRRRGGGRHQHRRARSQPLARRRRSA